MKKFSFKLPEGKVEFAVENGEIVKINSISNEYGKQNLEKTLDVTLKADLDMFLSLRSALLLNTKHYKLVQQSLKRRKRQMEEEIKKISAVIAD